MLLYFKTANSRSFAEEVEFSMIAADFGDKLLENTISLDKYGVSVLKSSVIYGANASGKSNLLKAMVDGSRVVLNRAQNLKGEELRHCYNKNQEINQSKPTRYVFGIFVDNVHFEYSFSHNAERIVEEQLIEFQPDQEPICHFERKYDLQTRKYDWSAFSESFQNEAATTLKTFIVKKNNLFLSVAANLSEDSEVRLPIAETIYAWFEEQLAYVINLAAPGLMGYEPSFKLIRQSPEVKKLFLDILEKTDFVIKDLIIEESKDEDGKVTLFAKSYHKGFNIHGEPVDVEYDFLKEESTGTQQLVAWLVPWLIALSKHQVLMVDELGNSMHPLLSEYLVNLFHKHSKSAQLIFTTHDVKLMNREKLRDDQIWLVHRDREGNSTIEPLSNYAIEDDKLLDNVYLQGIVGGVPEISCEPETSYAETQTSTI
jgi:hypothetical protein